MEVQGDHMHHPGLWVKKFASSYHCSNQYAFWIAQGLRPVWKWFSANQMRRGSQIVESDTSDKLTTMANSQESHHASFKLNNAMSVQTDFVFIRMLWQHDELMIISSLYAALWRDFSLLPRQTSISPRGGSRKKYLGGGGLAPHHLGAGFRHPGTYPKKPSGFFWVHPPKKTHPQKTHTSTLT